MADDDKTLEQLQIEAEAELKASLDAYQAVLEAALLKKPLPEDAPVPDLTPPDDDSDLEE